MPGGSLRGVVASAGGRLYEGAARRYLGDALRGLAYLHGEAVGIVHGGLTLGCLLVGGDSRVCIGGFGAASLAGDALLPLNRDVTAGAAYLSREALLGQPSAPPQDVWSLACCAVALTTGGEPWAERGGDATAPGHHPAVPPHLSPQLQSLLTACFAADAARRPTAAELLSSTYFNGAPCDIEGFEPFGEYAARTRDANKLQARSPSGPSQA
jgi:serine/threonine protein kinase